MQCTRLIVGSKRPIRSLQLEDLNGKHSGTGKTQEPKFSQYKMWTHPMFKAWPHLTSAPKVSDLIKSIHLESAQECHGQRAGKYMEVPRPIPPLSLSFSLSVPYRIDFSSFLHWFLHLHLRQGNEGTVIQIASLRSLHLDNVKWMLIISKQQANCVTLIWDQFSSVQFR